MRRGYPLGPYGLSLVLFLLAAAAMGMYWHFNWDALVAQAAEQGEGPPAFYTIWSVYWSGVWENLLSEWWQLFTFVVLTTFLVHRGSHESRDGQDEFEAETRETLKAINRRLDALHNRLNTPQDQRGR